MVIHLITLFVAAVVCSAKITEQAPNAPANMRYLGPETYSTIMMNRLRAPQFGYINLDFAAEKGYELNGVTPSAQGLKDLQRDFAFAGEVQGESGANPYLKEEVVSYVARYGGDGLGPNFGDGRSEIRGEFRFKGGRRSHMVGTSQDADHNSGASVFGEGVKECVAANLLYYQAPFATYRCMTIVLTGTTAAADGVHFEDRAVTVTEDPLRFAHFVMNTNAIAIGGNHLKEDSARVKAALKKLARALPLPKNFVRRGKTEQQILRAGIFEAFERQAVVHAYLWAHKMVHGATSPSNASPDGRLFDWGNITFMKGYNRVAPVEGEDSGTAKVFIVEMFKEIRQNWVDHLPKALTSAVPSEDELFGRFTAKYEQARRDELVRMAGTIEDIYPELMQTPAAQALGEFLLQMTEAGNDQVARLWLNEQPKEDRYNIEKILNSLARAELSSLEKLGASIRSLVPESETRTRLVQLYQSVFIKQRELAQRQGVLPQAESRQRILTAALRNKRLDLQDKLGLTPKVRELLAEAKVTGNWSKMQIHMQNLIDENRTEFRDADAFTVVVKERHNFTTGDRIREIFDLRANKMKTVILPKTNKCEESLLKAAA